MLNTKENIASRLQIDAEKLTFFTEEEVGLLNSQFSNVDFRQIYSIRGKYRKNGTIDPGFDLPVVVKPDLKKYDPVRQHRIDISLAGVMIAAMVKNEMTFEGVKIATIDLVERRQSGIPRIILSDSRHSCGVDLDKPQAAGGVKDIIRQSMLVRAISNRSKLPKNAVNRMISDVSSTALELLPVNYAFQELSKGMPVTDIAKQIRKHFGCYSR